MSILNENQNITSGSCISYCFIHEPFDLDYEGVDVYYYQSMGIDIDISKVLDALKEEDFKRSRNDYKNRVFIGEI